MIDPEPIDIVLVGDLVDEGASRDSIFDWDNPTWTEVEQIVEWLGISGRRVEIVPSIDAFVNSAGCFRDKIVFPLWRGGPSRNRTAIVPAVCEAHSLPYVGADAFGQTVCQDKSVSKHILIEAGFDIPSDLVVARLPLDILSQTALEALPLPLVVKPLSSACSIGVEDASLCADRGEALRQIARLIRDGFGPVICETFVRGSEISICVIESGGRVDLRCVGSHETDAGQCPFSDRLFTHQEKIRADRDWRIGSYLGEVDRDVWTCVERLISRLGPVDLLRIDGRITNGRFTAIELTPDIHLGLDSMFIGGFQAQGIPPPTVLDAVVTASQRNQPSRQISRHGLRAPPQGPSVARPAGR
jgi:D-alanine-D-alanine ligase